MPTTSNFGWTTPADTDLVKDGAAAIRTLGNGIDTSFLDLKGGTTGQVLSKASNTDLDFSWVAQDDSNAIQNAIVDAKGDIITATAADTPARLASSAVNGDVLTVDTSTSTGLKWAAVSGGAGNLVQIATGNLTGASVTISSLSTYTELLLLMKGVQNSTNNGGTPYFRINNNSGSNYEHIGGAVVGGATAQSTWNANNQSYQSFTYDGQDKDVASSYIVRFFNCKNAGFTSYDIESPYYSVNYGGADCWAKGIYKVSEAVSSLVVANTGGNWSAGTYTLYGG